MKFPQLALSIGTILLLLAPPTRADDMDGLFSAVRNAGDVDGDGTNDLMIADRAVSPGSVRVVSGNSHEQLLVLRSQSPAESLPASMDRLGDINADGKSDMIVCWRSNSGATASAHACVYSGSDGRSLYAFANIWTAATGGDINADLIPDILLGGSDAAGWRSEKAGRVQVRSGRDGSLLHEKFGRTPIVHDRFGPDPSDNFGVALAGLGDVDGDAHGDFVIGAPGEPSSLFAAPNSLELFSGRDGHSIARVEGRPDWREDSCWSIVPLDDLDGDGVRELLVGALHTCVSVLSGRDLHRIHRGSGWEFTAPDSFAASLDALGDIDGDGLSDWIVGANGGWSYEGYAQVYSSRNGEVTRVEFLCKRVGVDVCGLGDVDGDRVPDEVIASPKNGWVRLLSGKDGTLIHEINVAELRTATPKIR